MQRRSVLGLVSVLAAEHVFSTPLWAESRNVELDGVSFNWRHSTDRLYGMLRAPATGWIAVGFNNSKSLRNTRFVIADVFSTPPLVEEHIALVPNHESVEALQIAPELQNVSTSADHRRATLAFSVPHLFSDFRSLQLDPGSPCHLMLAWSNERDFQHHSAWRRHVDVIL